MPTKNTKIFEPLDEYEADLKDSLNKVQQKSIDSDEERAYLKQGAENSLKKDVRISIRLNSRDLKLVRVKAMEEGIPYQTFISSLIHKYVNE